MKLGVLTGLAREVNCLPKPSTEMLIACAGAMPDQAEHLSKRFIDQGCMALLSFGIAGALDPDVQVGDTVVSTGVINAKGDVLFTDNSWLQRVIVLLDQSLSPVHKGLIYGTDKIISTPQLKSKVYASSKAICVDMETHRMALVSSRASVPFLAIRVISDNTSSTIPSAALGVIGKNGKPLIGRVIRGLLRHPNQVTALMALSRDMETSLKTLRRVPGILGPLLCAA
jgi:adenosylhomocysteine nucleosidase